MLHPNLAWQILSVVSLVIGFSCLFFAFFLPENSLIFTITLAMGIAFLPMGLISIITSFISSNVIEKNVRRKLDEISTKLEASIYELKTASTYLRRSKELGVLMVYQNRIQALEWFLPHLEEYVQRSPDGQPKEIVFVASSLKGAIEDDPKHADQMERILRAAKKKCDFRFLLTHPFYSSFREAQEDRPPGAIALEILHAIAWLEDRDVPQTNIKLYKGTPTCFMIASTEKMLINPYPYQREAYRSFCLELENTRSENSIYYSFLTNHFYKPWYGEEKTRDHLYKPNTLSYIHEALEGPFTTREVNTSIEPFADFFVVNDTGSFYLAVNVRGLESEIPYNRQPDGSCLVVRIGKSLSVKLLDLSEDHEVWKEIGTIELSDNRYGFWHGMLRDAKSFNTYSMIGIFDNNNPSPFLFEKANKLIDNKPLPLLWKWLVPRSSVETVGSAQAP